MTLTRTINSWAKIGKKGKQRKKGKKGKKGKAKEGMQLPDSWNDDRPTAHPPA